MINECFGLNWNLKKTEYDKNDQPLDINRDISKDKDLHEAIDKVKPTSYPRADVFYGDKRIFLVIHCSQKKRKEFNDKLIEISKMPNPKSNAK